MVRVNKTVWLDIMMRHDLAVQFR